MSQLTEVERNDFENWNPLIEDFVENCFIQTELDCYDSTRNDHGNEKSSNGQKICGDQSKRSSKSQNYLPYLILREIPKNFNNKTGKNLFKKFGMQRTYWQKDTNSFFIYFKTFIDMEKAFVALENGELRNYGNVEIGKHTAKKDNKHVETQSVVPVNKKSAAVAIDLESRTIIVPKTTVMHPTFELLQLSFGEYASERRMAQYLEVTDEHVLERAGLYLTPNISIDVHGTLIFRAGRVTKCFTADVYAELNVCKKEKLTTLEDVLNHYNAERCYICGAYTDCFCGVCLTVFCSAKCQLLAANVHDCAKKLIFMPVEGALNVSYCHYDHKPSSGSLVVITAFEKSNIVYVRSKSPQIEAAHFNVINDIQMRSQRSNQLKFKPKCGQMLLLKLQDEYLRAIVLSESDAKDLHLLCIDYGSVEVQPMDKLYEISQYLANLPCYVHRVQLQNVSPCYLRLDFRHFFYNYLEFYQLRVEYNPDEYPSVRLYDAKLNLCINDFLNLLVVTPMPTLAHEVYAESCLLRGKLPTGRNVDLVITDNSFIDKGYISCTRVEFAPEIQKFQQDIQNYGKSIENEVGYAPQVFELCVAIYEPTGKWCRGECIELVCDQHPTIFFIDYGNISIVSMAKIRRYPPQFTQMPILVEECQIEGFSQHAKNIEYLNRMHQKLQTGARIHCEQVSFDEKQCAYLLKITEL